MKKLILILASVFSLSFAADNEVDSGRFFWGNGVLSDTLAHMEWQDNVDGRTKNWDDAVKYCDTLELNGKSDWRLPSLGELTYAYKLKKKFHILRTDYYWSFSESISNSDEAWNIAFFYGDTYYNSKATKLYVRCVRGKEYEDFDVLNDLGNKE